MEETGGIFHGFVKWYNVKKGYGFIVNVNDKNEKTDVFIHARVIRKLKIVKLDRGTKVQFSMKTTHRGCEVTSITQIDVDFWKLKRRNIFPKTCTNQRICFNCNTLSNHIAKNCPLGPLPRRCFICKEEDHTKVNCPWITPMRCCENLESAQADKSDS